MRVEATEPQAAQPASSLTQLAEAEELLGQVFPSFEGRTRADTEQALRDFQVTRGLEPHGRLDGETLDQLRRAADWIRHEKRGNEPAMPTHGHPRSARPTIDTQHAMLAKSLDAKVTPSAPSPSPDEVLELEFRAPSQAERIILAGLLGGSGAWEHLRDLAVRFGKTIVVGLGGDVSAGFERGAVSGGVYFGPDGEIGLTGSIGFGGTTSIGSASLTGQVMVLDGDIDKLSGLSVSVGGSGGAGGGTGGVSFIWDITSATPIGVAFELGVGAGPALEGYLQGTLGGRNEPVVAE